MRICPSKTLKILVIAGLLLIQLVNPVFVFSGSPTTPAPFQNLLPIIQTASQYKFPQYTVTNVIIVPADIDLDPDYPRLVSEAVKTVQTRFSELLDGQTFQINQENGDPIIIKSTKPLGYFCNPQCDHNRMSDELKEAGFPVYQNQTVLNIFGAGLRNFSSSGFGDWVRNTDSGQTWMGENVLSQLKGTQKRENEILCAAMFGMPCTASNAMTTIAHELGHSFGLLRASRWAKNHSCTERTSHECKDDLDPKFRPGIEEARSIMSQASNLQYNFNDSCVNPEKTLLKNSKFLGGKGYGGLDFEKCLGPTIEDIKIINIEANEKVYPGDTIVLQTEGLQPTDKETKIFFSPAWDLALNFKRVDINRLEVSIPPRSFGSGDVVVTVTRENNRTVRSNPYPVNILTLAPRLDSVDPLQAKPGDIITLTGENFVIDTEILKSFVPIVNIRGLRVEDFIEYDNKHIKLQIPKNVSFGINNVWVEVHSLQKGFQSYIYNTGSNNLSLRITGPPVISAKLDGPSTVQVGKAITLLATIDSENTLFESAEIWIQTPNEDKGCSERRGTWCKVGSTALPVKAILNISYTPQMSGGYLAVINAYGKEGATCSGNPDRPQDWIDCGEQSRLYIKVNSNQINATYFTVNNSEKKIRLLPKICEIIDGKRECTIFSSLMEETVAPPNTSRTLMYIFTKGVEGIIKEGTQYEVSCYLEVDEGQEKGKKVFSCPSQMTRAGNRINFNVVIKEDGSIESFESSPAAEQSTQNLQKSVVGILVNGQRLGFGGTSLSIRLPDIVAKGTTQPIPVTVKYSDDTSFSRNIVFRYKLAGTQESGEKALPGEECDPQRFSCFAMAERSDNNPEFLFCRNLGKTTNNRYEWVTQKFTSDICQGKEGITSTCGDGQGEETKYWCTGETWVDQSRWATIQKQKEERQKQATQTTSVEITTPQGTTGELSCSLSALPEKIKTGENITWVIQSNFKGISAQWGKDKRGEINPSPVTSFTNTNYWSETYPYKEAGGYTQYATVKTEDGRECITNTVEVVVEKRELAEAITAPVQNITAGPKTISRIILTVPPYGQQRVINQGEQIRFSLPETGGVPQTIQLPITIIYSDGSTSNKTISFAYKGNSCGLSGGKCANSNGQTRDGYQCSTYRSDLAGCSIEKDNVYPHCYTSCSKSPSENTTTTASTPSQSTQTQNLNCAANGGVCADSAGITADQTKKCGLESYRSDYTGCSQYYYCYTSCGPNQTSALPQTGTATANCSGAGEFCADSEGGPKDSGYQCSTGNKAYRNNSAKDQWCQGGEPGWYCWLCQ